jgi:hypothetical protein
MFYFIHNIEVIHFSSIMSNTIISFDIGIKNLAYCIFSLPTFSVLAWDVVNLVPTNIELLTPFCNCFKTKGGGVCGKKASYSFGDKNYCNIHSKNSGKLFPDKETSPPAIKKLKLNELIAFCERHLIATQAIKKPDLIASAIQHFERNCLVPIVKPKTSNANQVHLVDIGKRIKLEFDERLKTLMPQITHVILENQISPIAGRMNTIQGMLSQYFIMRNDSINIEFISSIGKLKGLSVATSAEGATSVATADKSVATADKSVATADKSVASAEGLAPNTKTTYKEHKADGIYFCKQFLENNAQLLFLKQIIEVSHKKDDLADSFLQGIYFMKRGNMISYNDNFHISSIM